MGVSPFHQPVKRSVPFGHSALKDSGRMRIACNISADQSAAITCVSLSHRLILSRSASTWPR
jgi:hypothetical protein